MESHRVIPVKSHTLHLLCKSIHSVYSNFAFSWIVVSYSSFFKVVYVFARILQDKLFLARILQDKLFLARSCKINFFCKNLARSYKINFLPRLGLAR